MNSNSTIADLENFLEMLEQHRLDLVEAIATREAGYTDEDVGKLAVEAGAVQSVREAIAYRRKFEGPPAPTAQTGTQRRS